MRVRVAGAAIVGGGLFIALNAIAAGTYEGSWQCIDCKRPTVIGIRSIGADQYGFSACFTTEGRCQENVIPTGSLENNPTFRVNDSTHLEILGANGGNRFVKISSQQPQASPPVSTPMSGAAVAVSSGTGAMGINFRYVTENSDVMIVGTGGPCATTDLGLYEVRVPASAILAMSKGARSPFLENPVFTLVGKAEGAPGLELLQPWNSARARSVNEELRVGESRMSEPGMAKIVRQIRCLKASHVQYEQAIYGWFQANWGSCPNRCMSSNGLYPPADFR